MNFSEEDEIPKSYYSVTEVAEMIGVQATVLRYWETEFKDLKPRKNKNGKRMYSQFDIDFLKKLHFLLKVQKYTIKGAQELLKNNPKGVEFQSKSREVLLKVKKFLEAIKSQIND